MVQKTLQDVINKLHANQQADAQDMRNLQRATQATASEVASLNKIFSAFFLQQSFESKELLEATREAAAAQKPQKVTNNRNIASGNTLGGFGGGLAGLGIGMGAAGAGLGAFFVGLAGAEGIMNQLGTGDNLKSLMVNLAEGLQAFETPDLVALGAALAGSALFVSLPGVTSLGVATGMGALGLGIGGFFAGLALGDAAASYLNADGAAISKMMENFGVGLSGLASNLTSDSAMIAAGILGATALFTIAIPGTVGKIKTVTGLAALGLGIGGFFAGLNAAEALGLQTDGTQLAAMMTNFGVGVSALAGAFAESDATKVAGLLAGGAALFATQTGAVGQLKIVTGLTSVGLGIGGFFAGINASGYFDVTKQVDGELLKKQMKNLAEGLGAFSDRDMAGLAGAFAVGGIFGALPGGSGLVVGAKVAVGLGIAGAAIGAFFAGIGAVGEGADVIGIDGSGFKKLSTNIAEGLVSFNEIETEGLTTRIKALAGIGPAIGLFVASFAVKELLEGGMEKVRSVFNFLFGSDMTVDSDDRRTNAIQAIVTSLKPLEDIDQDMTTNLRNVGDALDSFMQKFQGLANMRVTGSVSANVAKILTDMAQVFELVPLIVHGGKLNPDSGINAFMKGLFGNTSDILDFGGGLKSLKESDLQTLKTGIESLYNALGVQMVTAAPANVPALDAFANGRGDGGLFVDASQTDNSQNTANQLGGGVGNLDAGDPRNLPD
mgnify:FL=1